MAEVEKEGEFEFIAGHLRPLAAAGALDLSDDAALLDPPPGCQLVLTKDAMVEGVHFFPNDPAGQIAQKLLRVNLSDLAAMGARPLGYLLALARPTSRPDAWLHAFCAGLAADQVLHDIRLLGGDTVATPGPLTLSLTAIGAVPTGQALRRNGAHAGDDVYVSGTLGDAALGLQVLRSELHPTATAAAFLIDRYRLPQPRLALGQALRGLATAAIDISDGLLADLGHILVASGVGARIEADRLPLSPAARGLDNARAAALAGGDDYELAFTAPPARRPDIKTLANRLDLPLTRIGRLTALAGLRVIDAAGRNLNPTATGWRHF